MTACDNASMIRIDIRPVWRFRAGTERDFDFRLIALLAEIEAQGKLTHAAEAAAISYRHAWNLIAQWEEFFGAALVTKAQGRGSNLTPLGKRLLWAGKRAQARLAPELDNLANEFARALNESLTESPPALVMHASHDFAVAMLRERSAGTTGFIDLQYRGSFDALAALRRRECDVAGFHVPEGRLGALMEQRYRESLPLADFRLVTFVSRVQGFMVQAGNPLGFATIADLCRDDVRMVNRQRGSGTRALLEFLVSTAGLDRDRMKGYDTEETTHGAVAALVAGRQADVGFGVQAAASEYGLGFVPVCRERYYFACRAEDLDSGPMRSLLAMLRDARFIEEVGTLPGYAATGAGRILANFEPATAAT
jgi:molybdate transport repressor ModE-like protein